MRLPGGCAVQSRPGGPAPACWALWWETTFLLESCFLTTPSPALPFVSRHLSTLIPSPGQIIHFKHKPLVSAQNHVHCEAPSCKCPRELSAVCVLPTQPVGGVSAADEGPHGAKGSTAQLGSTIPDRVPGQNPCLAYRIHLNGQ